jgi:polyphosphate kinase
MFERTHIKDAPWWIVEAVDKKRARLNCIQHLLQQVAYSDVPHSPVALPDRIRDKKVRRGSISTSLYVPEVY